MFRALAHRNFRRFFVSQAISILGTWLQQIALAWLVYRTTGSAFLLGVVTFANQGPILVIAPISGLLADRFDRRRLLIFTQSLAAVQAALLAALTLSGLIQPWHIVTLAILYGIAMGLDAPVRHSLFVEMLADREDLPNAIALNSFLMNAARLVGPSIAGVALLFVSEGTCFALNALSYLAVLWVARTLPAPKRASIGPIAGYAAALKEAAAYAWHEKTIRYLLAIVASTAFFASSYMVLMPVFAKDIFGGGSDTLGFLVGAAGLGAVAGTGYLAARGNPAALSRRLVFTSAMAGLALAAVGLTSQFWLALPLMACVGFGIIVTAASSNMILQSMVPDAKRGRIVSFYAAAFLGVMPLGGLAAGALASQVGAPATAISFGACCFLSGVLLGGRLRKI
ncbi:MAG TPA: MFS transporter [Burkholderiales bacterium]|nr:MFS transporter [Burkholderiales bacterium]